MCPAPQAGHPFTVPGHTNGRKKRKTQCGAENWPRLVAPPCPCGSWQEKGIVLTHIMVKGKTGPGTESSQQSGSATWGLKGVFFKWSLEGRRTHGRDIWLYLVACFSILSDSVHMISRRPSGAYRFHHFSIFFIGFFASLPPQGPVRMNQEW